MTQEELAQKEWNKMPGNHREIAKQYLPLLPNGNADHTSLTCARCSLCDTCEFRWDLYNTNGDCLAEK